ncbi:MAG: IPExxxVDY family protein [Bacteroidales bacterium]|nr:IPExxxVDY family protein [Bacteroidales bacterium]
MKSLEKKIRHKLRVDTDDSDRYFGIVSTEADYRISLIMNRELGLKLKNSDPVTKSTDKKEIQFSKFTSVSDYSDISWDLISNNSGREKLFSKLPALDYILIIKGVEDDETGHKLTHSVRNIKEITAVFVLDKNRQLENSILQIIP